MNPYISDLNQLQLIKNYASNVFKLSDYLPSAVFRENMSAPKFLEFVNFTTNEFADLVKAVANIFDDSSVYLLAQHPPADDTETWFGHYGAVEFSCKFPYEHFFSAITYAGPSGNDIALCYSGVSMYIFGTSGSWGVYIDHDSDLILVSVAQEFKGFHWPDSNLLLSRSVVKNILRAYMVPPYVEAFVKNYNI